MYDVGILKLRVLDNTESILDQLDALYTNAGRLVFFSVPYKSGGMSDIDCPINANFAGIAYLSTANAKTVFLIPESGDNVYRMRKSSGVWRSSWEIITFNDLA